MSTAADRAVVLDASVVVKLVLVEELTPTAWRLYDDAFERDRPLVAPALLANEVTNAVYRQLRRGSIGESMADAAVETLPNLGILLTSPPALVAVAYAFAKLHRLAAVYDALYVVLARDLGADLWTDDLRLLHALGPAAPWVRWLGDYDE